MTTQDCGQTATDSALQLFHIAALMLGDEKEAVSLVEESVAKVEADPCAEAEAAYAQARSVLLESAVQRLAGLYPEGFAVPAAEAAEAGCLQTDEVEAEGLTGEQFGAFLSGGGRAFMRDWLQRLTPALRAIFVLRAVAGQDGEQTAESLRRSGARGAQGWRGDEVGTAYRQALCSLASSMSSRAAHLMPA